MQFNLARIRECKQNADFLSYQLHLSHERFNAFGFEPLAAAPLPAAKPTASIVRNSIATGPRTKLLVVIPTLDVGGAEVDLLRNLPCLGGSELEIVVFTFLARGAMAGQLAATGIEIVGPFIPFRLRWFGNLKRAALGYSRRLALASSRFLSQARDFVAGMASETVKQTWRQFRIWLRSRDRSRRTRYFTEMLRRIPIAARRLWAKSRADLKWCLSSLIGQGRSLTRLLPAPLSRLVHEALVWAGYLLIGLGLVPFIRARRIALIHTVLPNSYIVGSIANFWFGGRSLIMSRVGLNSYQQKHPLRRFVERRLCHRKISAAVGNCAAILEELRDEGIPESKLRLVRNGIDIADFSWQMVERDGARDGLGLPGTAIVISAVANLHLYKGHADLLRALHSVRRDLPDWILLAVGRDIDGNQARLEALAEELGIRHHVRFLGQRTDVPTILSAADIHVSCSHTEGLPNNILKRCALTFRSSRPPWAE
jgi:glycosyltransferase involved in cell wall biosynthesis